MTPRRRAAAPPPSSVDGHVHVFDPARFPYAEARRYTPPPAPVSDLLRLHERIGIERMVLVQPSVYGTDNACLLGALAVLGPRARGVAVIGPGFSRGQLDDLYAAGVRGVRLNLAVNTTGQDGPLPAERQLRSVLEALGDAPFFLQLNASLAQTVACAPLLGGIGRPVLLDHFGHARADAGIGTPDFTALLALLSEHPHLWLKLSGPYQVSSQGPHYPDVAPIARALIAAAPRRVVWGSDWPHTGGSSRRAGQRPTDIEPFRSEDDARNLGLLWDWAADEPVRRGILVHNPARLFGF